MAANNQSPPKESSAQVAANTPVRSILFGIVGLVLGSLLFSLDTAVERLGFESPTLHLILESAEYTLVGPGLGLLCLLLAERVRTLRTQARQQAIQEREKRLLVLGRMAAAVAHEVRNPLHTLRLVMDELRLEQPALSDHALNRHIDDSIERIDRAVDLVYRLARPESEDDGAADLVACLHVALTALKLRYPECTVSCQQLPAGAHIRCAAAGVRIMLDNLLRNAAEAQSPTATITLFVTCTPTACHLRITNPGMIATPLTDGSSKPDGLGIGLTIVRHLAEGVGGTFRLTGQDGLVHADLHLPAWQQSTP